MTRFILSFFLTTPLLLAACGDAGETADSPAATHEMPDGTVMAGAEHTHVESGSADASSQPTLIDGVQVVEIEAGAMGYQPRQIHLDAGAPARLVFTRTTEGECSSQITLPAYDVAATDLPMNEAVAIEFTPSEAGEVEFVCGMDMQRGTIAIVS